MDHTPTPWNFEKEETPRPIRREHTLRIYAEDPGPNRDFHIGCISSVDQETRYANARLIVNSVNNYANLAASHKELVEALHRAVTELEFWGKGHSDAEILIAKDALANAEKLTK